MRASCGPYTPPCYTMETHKSIALLSKTCRLELFTCKKPPKHPRGTSNHFKIAPAARVLRHHPDPRRATRQQDARSRLTRLVRAASPSLHLRASAAPSPAHHASPRRFENKRKRERRTFPSTPAPAPSLPPSRPARPTVAPVPYLLPSVPERPSSSRSSSHPHPQSRSPSS
jgi:hypothetical protein